MICEADVLRQKYYQVHTKALPSPKDEEKY